MGRVWLPVRAAMRERWHPGPSDLHMPVPGQPEARLDGPRVPRDLRILPGGRRHRQPRGGQAVPGEQPLRVLVPHEPLQCHRCLLRHQHRHEVLPLRQQLPVLGQQLPVQGATVRKTNSGTSDGVTLLLRMVDQCVCRTGCLECVPLHAEPPTEGRDSPGFDPKYSHLGPAYIQLGSNATREPCTHSWNARP